MSVIEKSSLMQYKGADGNMYAVHPVTDTDNVKGLEEWNKATLLGTSYYTLPTGGLWQSVCYGNGKFVAVGNNTVAAYSTDGITWTQTTMPSSKNWYSVCYGDGKFVAVAYNSSAAAYSSDGINWTQTTLPYKGWQSVCYGDGKFVAIDNDTTAVYSTDGITWTQTTMPTSATWISICYGNGKFVAVTYDNTIAAYSTDGINWTQTEMPSKEIWQSVCYGNDKFVAVKSGGHYFAYSKNGIDWNSVYGTALSINDLMSICYGNGKFVAVGENTVAAYSTNGNNGWVKTTMPTNAWYRSVCYGNGKFVAVAYNSSYATQSSDGINWSDGVLAVINPAGTDVSDTLKEVLGIDGLQTELDGKAPESHTHTKDQISDFPTSMPASDVKAWAKADAKPTYTASEVGADASGAAATALTDAKAYTDSAIQTAIQNTWEASY